ncbi:MAG TPA: hypothetical protein VJJ24_03535 [Candidatus Paceibacterota bacterium]
MGLVIEIRDSRKGLVMNLRNLIFVCFCLTVNNVAKAGETPQDTAIAFFENANEPGEKDKFLLAHTLSGGWMSEGIYEEGIIANNPGEGVYWLEYELAWPSGWFVNAFLAISDDHPGFSTSYANEVDATFGYREVLEGKRWDTTLEGTIFYWNLGTPSLGSSKEDVWGLGFEVSWVSEESAISPYFKAEQFFGINDDGAGTGFVARGGIRGEWGNDEATWNVDLAVGRNFGWFETTMTYAYIYVGPSFKIDEDLYLSIPEVTGVLKLDGTGDSLIAIGFTFTKTWGD